MDGYISYSPFFYAMYKVEFNTATWYWYYFHNKGKHHPGRQVLPKEQDQQLSLIDSILCFNSELLLSRVIQFANQSPFFFSLMYILCFIVLYWKVQALPILTSQSNYSMKVLIICYPTSICVIWKMCLWHLHFLNKRLANTGSRFEIMGLIEKVTLLFSSKTS